MRSDICIGCYQTYQYFFEGLLDELKVWNKVLSVAERTNVFNGVAGW